MGQQSSQIQPSQPPKEREDRGAAHDNESSANSDNIERPSPWRTERAKPANMALESTNGDSAHASKKRQRTEASTTKPRKVPKHGPQKLRGMNIQPDFESSANAHVFANEVSAEVSLSSVQDINTASIPLTHNATELWQSPAARRELDTDEKAERKRRKREKREAIRLAEVADGENGVTKMDAEEKAERKRRKRAKREARILAKAAEDGHEHAPEDLTVTQGRESGEDVQEPEQDTRPEGESTLREGLSDMINESPKKKTKRAKKQSNVDEQLPTPESSLVLATPKNKSARQAASDGSHLDVNGAAAPIDDGTHATSTAADSSELPSPKSSKPKKNKKLKQDEAPPKTKRRVGGTAHAKDDKAGAKEEIVYRMGPFTEDEKIIADRVFEKTCRAQNITEYELSRQLHEEWRSLEYFKEDVFDALPERDNAAIRKFVLRRYHPHDRGPWSEDQDNDLRAAHAKHPGKWVDIAKLVGRHPDSVRDRWRNHLMYGEHLETGYWEAADETKLITVVENALNTIQKQRPGESRENLETWIDWNYVATMMDSTRSRKRCMEKYRLMKEQEAERQANGFPSRWAVIENTEAQRAHAEPMAANADPMKKAREAEPKAATQPKIAKMQSKENDKEKQQPKQKENKQSKLKEKKQQEKDKEKSQLKQKASKQTKKNEYKRKSPVKPHKSAELVQSSEEEDASADSILE